MIPQDLLLFYAGKDQGRGASPTRGANFKLVGVQRGVVTLNTELVRLPMLCIDYLIVHEFCHLRVHNHSPAFYRLLDKFLPDWSARRERLNLGAVQ